ncbi:MAG: class I SAM-dependent methyltransferase [Woeseiaceae bacterium]
MTRTLEEIQRYWEAAAKMERDSDGLKPTARDAYLQRLVEAAMLQHMWPTARVLDVGCGDGASTNIFARHVGAILGLDYVSNLVERARAGEANNANFSQADVMDLSAIRAEHGKFDIVTSIRCLINLGTWENQARAIAEIAECVKPGGLFLLSEGWCDGMDGLNVYRYRAGLGEIQVVPYNLLIDRKRFEKEVRQYFEIAGYLGLGFYAFVTRVLQPLHVLPAPPRHDHPINATAAFLQQHCVLSNCFSECDFAGVYVLRRKTIE